MKPKPRTLPAESTAWEATEHVPGGAAPEAPAPRRGRPPKADALRKTGKPLQVYLPPELLKRVKHAAVDRDTTASAIVAELIEAHLR